MNILVIVPAKGKSQRIPGKNLKIISGLPLVDWTLKAIEECTEITQAILSSDEEKVLERASLYKKIKPVKRPQSLAQDTTSTSAVVDHILEENSDEYDYILILQPTSPLRTEHHISEAIKLFRNTERCQSLVSVCRNEGALNHLILKENGRTVRLFEELSNARTQDQPVLYRLNGAIYLVSVTFYKKNKSFLDFETVLYEMDKRSSIDIDELEDFELAQNLMKIVE